MDLKDKTIHESFKLFFRGFLSTSIRDIRKEVDTTAVAEMIFAEMIGTGVAYGVGIFSESLDNCLNSWIDNRDSLS
jgi:hypothetical protein